MPTIDYGTEARRFTCTICEHEWVETYHLRQWQNRGGTTFTMYYRNGHPAAPSVDDVVCPGCGRARGRLTCRSAAWPE